MRTVPRLGLALRASSVENASVIHIKQLVKTFGNLAVIKNVSFEIPSGRWASLTGPSGSGKSTLLSIIAGLELPTSGRVEIDGVNLATLSEDDRARFRARTMGFVFQSFRLLPHLTAFENVRVPLELAGVVSGAEADERVRSVLARVGLGERGDHKPSALSGGEQQRVAVARAFVAKPRLLLADEPTGNLDSRNGAAVLDLIRDLQNEAGSTVLVVTHDPQVAALASVQLKLRDGERVDG